MQTSDSTLRSAAPVSGGIDRVEVEQASLVPDPAPPGIAAGARADLTVLDYSPMTPMTISNVVDHVARGWTSAHVRDTMVGGRFVLRDRKLANVDERELVLRGRAAASRLWERMQGYS